MGKIGNIYGHSGGNFAGNVYDRKGIAPALRAHSGGDTEPMIIERKALGGVYCNSSERFERGVLKDISRTIKAEKHDAGILERIQEKDLHMEGDYNQRGTIHKPGGICRTITAGHAGNEPKIIVSMRGRNPDNPSDRTAGIPTEQRLEPNSQGICNTLTTVQKDNMVLEPGYGIRKLIPLECWRLMGVSDEDFRKAAGVCSKTQLYKQAGNSIVKNCLVGVFSQLGIKGVKRWDDGLKERYIGSAEKGSRT